MAPAFVEFLMVVLKGQDGSVGPLGVSFIESNVGHCTDSTLELRSSMHAYMRFRGSGHYDPHDLPRSSLETKESNTQSVMSSKNDHQKVCKSDHVSV